jgi:hypothetical protein
MARRPSDYEEERKAGVNMIKESIGHTGNLAKRLMKSDILGDYKPMRLTISEARSRGLHRKLSQAIALGNKRRSIERAHGMRELAKHSGAIIR